jgi:dethiobiotin synthetase
MSGVLIVSGTDTGIGKTVAAAGIAAALGAFYWKPVQAGIEDGTDSDVVEALGVPADHILPEAYRLSLPASPHFAAQHDGIEIDPERLALPSQRPLIVEGAGGLMVPLRADPPLLTIDQFSVWRAPVLLVARTELGTINHSLLSFDAMRGRGIKIAGILFVGEAHAENERVIPALSGARSFGRLPMLATLDVASLADAMKRIDIAAIRDAMGLAA